LGGKIKRERVANKCSTGQILRPPIKGRKKRRAGKKEGLRKLETEEQPGIGDEIDYATTKRNGGKKPQ